jgi:hypothetical protein
MSICLWQRVVLCGVAAKRRKFELLAASCLAPLSLGLSEPARALDECGALVGGSAMCTPTNNPYPNGINYSTNNTPINVTVQPNVQVVIQPGSATVNAVNLANTTAPFSPEADAALTVTSASIDNTANSSAPNKSGLRIQASGNATITATDTAVNVVGTQSTNAIWAIVLQSSNP